MIVYPFIEIKEAEAHAAAGHSALHLHDIVFSTSPRCFITAVEKRLEPIGHFFDLDKDRLVRRSKALGVKVIFIDHEDTPGQHVDLCGAPLARLLREHLQRLHERNKTDSIGRVLDILRQYPGTRKWGLIEAR